MVGAVESIGVVNLMVGSLRVRRRSGGERENGHRDLVRALHQWAEIHGHAQLPRFIGRQNRH